MTAPLDLYKDLVHLETMSREDVAMKDASSQTSLASATGGSGAVNPPLGEGEEGTRFQLAGGKGGRHGRF